MEILYFGVMVNFDSDEFGFIFVGEDIVWFIFISGDQVCIYESQCQGCNWIKVVNLVGFLVVDGGQYVNGVMLLDNQCFYFMICNNDSGWNGLNICCEIYFIKCLVNGWIVLECLFDYINVKGVNIMYLVVVYINGQEYFYFVFNCEGGRGGFDLWYVICDFGVDNLDYIFFVNLGLVVNSLGDEIMFYYNQDEGMFYFVFNGYLFIGGLDIFKV